MLSWEKGEAVVFIAAENVSDTSYRRRVAFAQISFLPFDANQNIFAFYESKKINVSTLMLILLADLWFGGFDFGLDLRDSEFGRLELFFEGFFDDFEAVL